MRILIIAYDFPPCHSSGVQRTLKFAENLAELGWDVRVLTANEQSYERVDNSRIVSEKLNGKIYRAKCINLKKTMSYKGKYFSIIDKFEKIWPWYFTGKKLGQSIINNYRPDVIFSTYPAFTAHCIAYSLVKKFAIPWIMDYRDPLRQHYDLKYKNLNSFFLQLENKFIQKCSGCIFTSDAATRIYRELYPQNVHKLITIRNGYDQTIPDTSSKDGLLILHSGILYPEDRNIDDFIYAIEDFLKKFPNYKSKIIVRFRGATATLNQVRLIENLGLSEIFEFESSISYSESIREISKANILLVVQNGVLGNQIPGKVYDYIATSKPIICLTTKFSALHEIQHPKMNFCYDRKDIVYFLANSTLKLIDMTSTLENYQYNRVNCVKKLNDFLLDKWKIYEENQKHHVADIK